MALEHKEIFNFVGYQCELPAGRMRLSKERWLGLTGKTFHHTTLSIVGLLMATEKQVQVGCLHLITAQCHLRNPSEAWMNSKSNPSSSGIAPTFESMQSWQPLCPFNHSTAPYRHVRQGWGVRGLTEVACAQSQRKSHILTCSRHSSWHWRSSKSLFGSVLIPMANITVVACITNKGGGIRNSSLPFACFPGISSH